MRSFIGCMLFASIITMVPLEAKDVLRIKFGKAPVLDGKIGDKEWSDATKISMSNGKAAYLKHDEDTLYIGFEGRKLLGSICVAVNDEVHVLHSSASLGTANYRSAGSGKKWKLVKSFGTWSRDPDSTWKSSGWKASIRGKEILEYAVSFKLLGLNGAELEGEEKETPLVRAALVVFKPPQPMVWPKKLSGDGCTEMMLIMGGPPQSITFDLDKWARLGSESAWLAPDGEKKKPEKDSAVKKADQ